MRDLQQWTIKCRDDSETYNWLVANTKACPKCDEHREEWRLQPHDVQERECKYEFCWVCSGAVEGPLRLVLQLQQVRPREGEGDDPDGKKKDTSRAALERYLHYYTRYTNHDNSLKLEIEAKKMEAKITEMEALGDNTRVDCEYLNEANAALHECRYALKFTYVFAFYLPKESNFRFHFEMQQTELERQTEELAEQLEKPVEEIERMHVVHCFNMALKRLRNLMELVEAERSRERGRRERQAAAATRYQAAAATVLSARPNSCESGGGIRFYRKRSFRDV